MTPSSPTSTPKGTCSGSLMEARWSNIQSRARQEDIGATVDRAMDVIERDNEPLKGVLPKNYGRDDLDKQVLGDVVDLVSNIKVGGSQALATDVLGQVYEYFLEQFAIAEGRKGGEFYTPRSVVRLLVEMIEPYERAGLRPLLRVRRHVRPVREVHRSPMPPETATAERRSATCPSTGRSPT